MSSGGESTPPAGCEAAAAETLYRRRNACSLCQHPAIETVVRLAPAPIANAFTADAESAAAQVRLPLDLARCRACGHVQLVQIVDRYRIFARSLDAHGASPLMVAHLRAFAQYLLERYPSSERALIIDIGCNDGTLLKLFDDAGRRVQGIEPAVNVAAAAVGKGIHVHAGFFTPAIADRIEEQRGRAAYVTAQMAFAETERPHELLEAVSMILARDGIFAFEVAYLGALVEQAAFDGITHRVLDYHMLAPLVRFFAANDFEIIAAETTPPHRGSIRVIAQRLGGAYPCDPSVERLLAAEERAGLLDPATFTAFAGRIEEATRVIAHRLASLRAAGCRIAAYGATACATTLLHHLAGCGVGADSFSFIADDITEKQGLYLPGLAIPIRPGSTLYDPPCPEVVVILAWNHADAIIARHADFRAAGGRFLVPLPDLREL